VIANLERGVFRARHAERAAAARPSVGGGKAKKVFLGGNEQEGSTLSGKGAKRP